MRGNLVNFNVAVRLLSSKEISHANAHRRRRGAADFKPPRGDSLVMYNYEVDPDLVRPRAPRGAEIDFGQGKTYLDVL